jgi:hypothetical protein
MDLRTFRTGAGLSAGRRATLISGGGSCVS